MSERAIVRLLLFLAASLLTACGAGLVTGAVASGGGDSPGAQPPSLTPTPAVYPLMPVPTALLRTVVIANAQISPGQQVGVQLRVPQGDGVVEQDQARVVVIESRPGSTTVGFDLDTTAIKRAFGVDNDIAARLAVLVDGVAVGSDVSVTLAQQPKARLYENGTVFLSPNGQQRVRVAVTGLRATTAAGFQLSVITADPDGTSTGVVRLCLAQDFYTRPVPPPAEEPPIFEGERVVEADVIGNSFAGPAQFVVDDVTSGRSTIAEGSFYRPEIQDVSPAQADTRGGVPITIRGLALAPLISGVLPGEPDLDALEVLFRKGQREVRLEGGLIRGSSFEALDLTAPSSPDGRPGTVDIVLRCRMRDAGGSQTTAEVVASGMFQFANPAPDFSPRGAVLDGDPIAVTPIALEGAPNSTQATDFGVLSSAGNFAVLQLLLAQENGMFTSYYSHDRPIANPAVAAERSPRDLLAGDFDGDATPDLLVVNAGIGGTAIHHIVLGQAAPAAPLGAVVRLPTPSGMAKGRVADFDGDGRDDIVLFPGPEAAVGQRPIVLLQRSTRGAPAFDPPIEVPVRAYGYEAYEVDDIDGDGHTDVAVAAARTQLRLDIAYGIGLGHFAAAPAALDFTVPGYLPAAASSVVGLHAMGVRPCAMMFVLSGLPAVVIGSTASVHPTTPPLLVLLRPTGPRRYQGSVPDVRRQVGAIDPFRSSLAADLDGRGTGGKDELVVGATGDRAAFALGMFRIQTESLIEQRRKGPNQPTTYSLLQILQGFNGKDLSALFHGVAFPENDTSGQAEVGAVFVRHQLTVDDQVERRLSTLLVADDNGVPQLLPADVGFGVALQGVVGGSFSTIGVASGGTARDLAIPSVGGIQIGDNNGFGALAPGNEMRHAGLVPETTTRVPAPIGIADSLLFLDDGNRDGRVDGRLRIGQWQPETGPSAPRVQTPTSISGDLRPLLTAAIAGANIDSSSRLQASDVDGDGVADLVALLRFVGRTSEGEAMLLLLRGRAQVLPGEFPFSMPTVALPVHGSATSFALGDFVRERPLEPIALELALAVAASSTPSTDDGNHVRFYRLDNSGSGPVWRRSSATGGASVLIAGNAPTRVAAADFDGDGSVDLLVAANGDAALRLYLNNGGPGLEPDEVAIESFQEALASPFEASPGRHTQMLLGDINVDGNVDVLLATEFTRADGTLTTSVRFYLGTGNGGFSPSRLVSPTRLGDRNAHLAIDLGDINSDGVLDLSVGWFQALDAGDNLRVLLGSSR